MKQLLYFFAGVGAGAYIGYTIAKKKYENLADEEVASVKEAYENKYREEKIKEKVDKVVTMAEDIVKENNYIPTEVNIVDEDDVFEDDFPKEERAEHPYIIDVYDYEDFYHGFEKTCVTYYAGNNVLVNDAMEEIDIDSHIGLGNVNHLLEQESVTAFIRNERLGTDFEVLFEDGEYTDE
jgi:hypothetical protein